ncbi:putative non-specific serine/threonine protein kinase [Helianthus anomalus]
MISCYLYGMTRYLTRQSSGIQKQLFQIDGRGLVLTDPQGTVVWTSLGSLDIAYGVMNDTGNFVIVENSLNKIWETFDSPAHTLLPTQSIKRGGGLMSMMSETNYSGGRFQLRLLHDGNLVLSNIDMFSRDPLHAYYISVTFDPSNATDSGDQLIFDATGYMYILRGNGKIFDLTPRDKLPIGDYYHRATLDSDGVFTQYYHPKNSTDNTRWEAIQFMPENICNRPKETIGSGACGLNNVCSLVDNYEARERHFTSGTRPGDDSGMETARGRFPNVPGYLGLLHMLRDGLGTSKTKYRGHFLKYLGF